MNDNDVAAFVIMVIFGAPVVAWITTRVLAHQERMEMIRRGIPPAGQFRPMPGQNWPPPNYSGPMPPPPGVRQYPYPPVDYTELQSSQRQLKKGITLTFIGFALLIGLGSIGPISGMGFAGPWLLGGLVPMFIGLAQIVHAVLSGARLPGINTGAAYSNQQTTFGPPPPQSGPTPPSQPAGPYAWRPGPTPEIERPPEQR
jgi:hypothetical protein